MTVDNLPIAEWTPIAWRGVSDWHPITDAPLTIREARRLFDRGFVTIATSYAHNRPQLMVYRFKRRADPSDYFGSLVPERRRAK